MRLTGIVLAAGKSSRLGRDKLSIVMPDGRCLAAWTLEAALNSDLEQVICVVKPEDSLAWIPSVWLHGASYGGTPGTGIGFRLQSVQIMHTVWPCPFTVAFYLQWHTDQKV
ncbi:NTP transferase domain-containing protein [Paenibacillus sp. 1A_MP2]|uniref:NTP transferase domain-containing protein n=1 Tax=Paenibacillus sp. 1A_MP2 TaxID=3457495 RepID=UPI003FCD8347